MSEWVSGLLAQNDSENKPSEKDQRHQRRALILLKIFESFLIEKTTKVDVAKFKDDVNKLQVGKLATDLTDQLDACYDKIMESSPVVLNPKWEELLADPLAFLTENKVTISCLPNRPKAGEKTLFRFYFKDGVYILDGTLKIKPNEYVTKQAWMIPVTNFADVKDSYGELEGAEVAADVNVALTTQFTGCCYCFQVSKDKKTLVAAHLDPQKGKGEDGESISKKLREGVGFKDWKDDDGWIRAYGRVKDPKTGYGYGDGRITIVAVKGKDGWAVFSQTNVPQKDPIAAQIFDPKDPRKSEYPKDK
jgi:hypothetical protein